MSDFPKFNKQMRLKAIKVWNLKKKGRKVVRRIDPHHWEVLRPEKPERPAKVRRDGDELRCPDVDPRVKSGPDKGAHYNQDRPCSHILLVMLEEEMVDLPTVLGTVWKKGNEPRPAAHENQAMRRLALRAPELLADLLKHGLPALAEEPPTGGRPRAPLYPCIYQSVMRVLFRMSNQVTQGAMSLEEHQRLNPWGPVGAATISRFHARPETRDILERLLALSTYPARPYEWLAHPDGTGLSEQHFSDYFEERPQHRSPEKEEQMADADPDAKPVHPRKHRWTYTEILWTYRYTMVASMHVATKSFGEAPWLIPLLERARLVFREVDGDGLGLKELGGDKAYNAYYLFDYAKRNGIEPQIKFKSNITGGSNSTTSSKKKALKRTYEDSILDPDGYAAKANRRNNAETGNRAAKQFLGSEVYNRGRRRKTDPPDFTSRQNEVLCMAIAYNLHRLCFMEVHEGIQVNFAEGALALGQAVEEGRWESLEALHKRFFKSGVPLYAAGAVPAPA